MKEVYTTGDVARLCNVAPRTASKWFDSGQLKGYLVPGGKDRRVPRDELLAFMQRHNIPTDSISGTRKVLLVGTGIIRQVVDGVTERGCHLFLEAEPFGAGFVAGKNSLDAVLIDFAVGTETAKRMCERLRGDGFRGAIFGTVNEDDATPLTDYAGLGFTACTRKPYDPLVVLNVIAPLPGSTPPQKRMRNGKPETTEPTAPEPTVPNGTVEPQGDESR